jgi:hypothetical protein
MVIDVVERKRDKGYILKKDPLWQRMTYSIIFSTEGIADGKWFLALPEYLRKDTSLEQ